jgi:hypothetical protein
MVRAKSITTEDDEIRRAFGIVGELVLMASALDYQLNQICISVLPLTPSPMLEPVVASIDSSRKVEILKAYASKIRAPDWKKAIRSHAKAVEEVNRWRNIAAHSVMSVRAGRPVLFSPAAAKLFRAIDLSSKTAERIDLARLEQAIITAEKAHAGGVNLLQNFDRVATERARRSRPKSDNHD